MSKGLKITALSNDAIDRMDAFSSRLMRGEVGGRDEYWGHLQEIIDAGVSFAPESANVPRSEYPAKYAIETRFYSELTNMVDLALVTPDRAAIYFTARLDDDGKTTEAIRGAMVEALLRAFRDFLIEREGLEAAS